MSEIVLIMFRSKVDRRGSIFDIVNQSTRTGDLPGAQLPAGPQLPSGTPHERTQNAIALNFEFHARPFSNRTRSK